MKRDPDSMRQNLEAIVTNLDLVNLALHDLIPNLWQVSDQAIEDVMELITVLKDLYVLHDRLEGVQFRLQGAHLMGMPDAE